MYFPHDIYDFTFLLQIYFYSHIRSLCIELRGINPRPLVWVSAQTKWVFCAINWTDPDFWGNQSEQPGLARLKIGFITSAHCRCSDWTGRPTRSSGSVMRHNTPGVQIKHTLGDAELTRQDATPHSALQRGRNIKQDNEKDKTINNKTSCIKGTRSPKHTNISVIFRKHCSSIFIWWSRRWFDSYVLAAEQDDGWQMLLVSLTVCDMFPTRSVTEEETTLVHSSFLEGKPWNTPSNNKRNRKLKHSGSKRKRPD